MRDECKVMLAAQASNISKVEQDLRKKVDEQMQEGSDECQRHVDGVNVEMKRFDQRIKTVEDTAGEYMTGIQQTLNFVENLTKRYKMEARRGTSRLNRGFKRSTSSRTSYHNGSILRTSRLITNT